MYAVIKTGGKQYRVEEGEYLRVEKLDVDAGEKVEIADVLMLVDGDNVQVGAPLIEGATVSATVREHGRGDKVKIVKFRRRKHSRRQAGHRQSYTEILIDSITASGAKKSPAKKKAAEPKAKAEPQKAAATSSEKDDLKKISGVGPKLEEKLNNLGVFTFQQIADFTPERVEEVDAELNFKGRIEREDWKGQAKILAAGGETEFSKKK